MGDGPAPTPADSPGFLLWHATLRWQREIAAALQPFQLTHVQFVLLASAWWLAQQGQLPNQWQLAQHANTDVKMTSQVIGRLVARDLVQRVADARDTRMKRIRITPGGSELAGHAIAAVEEADRRFFAPVAGEPALLAILRSLAGRPLSVQ